MKKKLERNYQYMVDWNIYRLEQNEESLKKLDMMLSKLDRDCFRDQILQKDIDDLESLKMIYETSIRNFDGQIRKYKDLIDALAKENV